MLLTHTRLNLEAYDGGELPHDIITRQPKELWIVAHEPVELDKPVAWRTHKKEGHVFIPLAPYLVRPEPDLAMAFMFQLGCRVHADFGRPIERLHIVTGHPIHEVDTEGLGNMWQMQLGFGFVLG